MGVKKMMVSRISLCVILILPAFAVADDPTADVERLVEQLRSPSFAQRRHATIELRRRGESAIAALEEASRYEDDDLSNRAFGILRAHMRGDDATRAFESEKALKRIAFDASHPRAIAAGNVLTPNNAPSAGTEQIGGFRKGKSIAESGRRGTRVLTIDENGTTFRFLDDGKRITVEGPDGKGGVKIATYRDAMDLKARDPNAFQKYRKFYPSFSGMRIRIGGGRDGVIPAE